MTVFNERIKERIELEIRRLEERLLTEKDPNMIHSINDKIDILTKRMCELKW